MDYWQYKTKKRNPAAISLKYQEGSILLAKTVFNIKSASGLGISVNPQSHWQSCLQKCQKALLRVVPVAPSLLTPVSRLGSPASALPPHSMVVSVMAPF